MHVVRETVIDDERLSCCRIRIRVRARVRVRVGIGVRIIRLIGVVRIFRNFRRGFILRIVIGRTGVQSHCDEHRKKKIQKLFHIHIFYWFTLQK